MLCGDYADSRSRGGCPHPPGGAKLAVLTLEKKAADATAISDLITHCQAAEDVAAMAFDPEPAPPQAGIVSVEMHLEASQASAENLETPLVAPEVWRERGEELAPAISDPQVRPEPDRAAWNEPVEIALAGEVAESATEPGSDQHMWLMPHAEPGSGR